MTHMAEGRPQPGLSCDRRGRSDDSPSPTADPFHARLVRCPLCSRALGVGVFPSLLLVLFAHAGPFTAEFVPPLFFFLLFLFSRGAAQPLHT